MYDLLLKHNSKHQSIFHFTAIDASKRASTFIKEDQIIAEMTNAMVAVYDTRIEDEAGIKKIQKAEFAIKELSITGKDYHTDEHVVECHNTGDWLSIGAHWAFSSVFSKGDTSARWLEPGAFS
jgi:hypothetical protein